MKFINNCLVYTDDYWQTAKAALGKIQYYNPVSKKTVSQYGLIADAVISGIIIGNDIVGGNIYSENYSSTAGTHIDLNNGDFSFAGGKLTYNSKSNILNVTGKITFESIDFSNDSAKTVVKDSLGITAINKEISDSNSTINKLKRCLEFTAEISSDYVISPYIGGGYLNISNNSYGSVIIDPSNIKKSGYIFGIYNNSSDLVMGVDTKGNGVFKGKITANIGEIGGFKINYLGLFYGDWGKKGGFIISPGGITISEQEANMIITKNYALGIGSDFRVTTDGALYATNGVIGGWNISSLGLECSYIQSSTAKWNVGLKAPTKDDAMFIYTSYYDTNLGANLISSYWEVGSGGVDTLFTYNVSAVNISASKVTSTIRFEETIQFGSSGSYYVNSSGNGVFNSITTNSITHMGSLSIGDYIQCKGIMEVTTSSNSSNVILHNDYDRKIYLRYDEQSRFYIVPHTSDGFDSQNCFYMDAYTGDCCARSFVNVSSIRYKENIKTLSDNFIDNFSKIRPVSFDYKPNIGYKNQYGLIAEEMEEIYPYVVTHDRDGNCEAIDYSKLTILLIKKVQAMDKEIRHLNEIITQYAIIK